MCYLFLLEERRAAIVRPLFPNGAISREFIQLFRFNNSRE